MNFEDLQKAWKAQPAGAKVTLDTVTLLKEVRRKQRKFSRMIFWRDAREVGVCAVLTWVFFQWGSETHQWAPDLIALACIWVGFFMVVDRVIQHRRRPVNNDPLRSCVESSLRQVTHQIWLLKNVFWWYVLPLLATEVVFSVCVVSHPFVDETSMTMLTRCFTLGYLLAVFGGVAWAITWLNQFAVRKTLQPRREQLENLLSTMD